MRLLQERAKNPTQYTESIPDFIVRVSQQFTRPEHLGPYVQQLELSDTQSIRCVLAAPPQHTKTSTTYHALVRKFFSQPGKRHAYVTFSAQRAYRVEEMARAVAQSAGIDIRFRHDLWFDPKTGTRIVWGGGPGIQGEPVDGLLVLDDLLSGAAQARSKTIKQGWVDWMDGVALPRCHRSASIIVMATRWADDDPSGVLIGRGWKYINLKALSEGDLDEETGTVADDPLKRAPGVALWPERKTVAELEALRTDNVFNFSALYQGAPRRKGAVFSSNPTYYRELPKEHQYGFGVDLASTAKTSADFSVCIEGYFVPEPYTYIDPETNQPVYAVTGKLYIVDVQRKQVDGPAFVLTLHSKLSRRRGPMLWYCSGTEKLGAQFIQERLPKNTFAWRPAQGDKFVRATNAFEAWNSGRILLPEESEDTPAPAWLHPFIDEVTSFSGVNDPHDDQVDALAAIWDLFTKFIATKKKPRRMSLPT